MKTYTLEKLTDALERHGIEYCDIHDDDPNYIRVEFDKKKEMARTVIFDKEDLIAIGQADKLLGGGIFEHIRLLTDDEFDYEKQEWRREK